MFFAKDIEGLPRTVDEVNKKAGWTWLNYQPMIVPNRNDDDEA
jgi:hypothetical protein